MKVVKAYLPKEFPSIEIHIFADEHIGDEHSDVDRILERIEYVKNTPNAYCILNGDIVDNATKTSIGDTYTQVFNPMEQLQRAVELFYPIKDKILLITHGNHENRTYKKEGINLSALIAQQLGISDKYTPTSAVLFVRFGQGNHHHRRQWYSIYALHGSGGGRKEGAKAIRLADMASIVDCDIYIHSHTHLPMVMKQGFYRIDTSNSTVNFVNKLFVNTAANLKYGGYGEAGEFKPSSMHTPVIYLSGTNKEFSARL
jgi:predicted phosphodiesterase